MNSDRVNRHIAAPATGRAASGRAQWPSAEMYIAGWLYGLSPRLTGDWTDSWDRVRQVAIEAIYALIEELDAG